MKYFIFFSQNLKAIALYYVKDILYQLLQEKNLKNTHQLLKTAKQIEVQR